ncbi:hypothetical protein DL240_02960 [Lujinxingia litoralis]|uniref:Methyltransferase domain-containing protein n=1 Tax=Lujinxingia litoralis TaxID=2211119 RepID=A0A328C9N8_9DELT|nr:class I SAM-dependent methyltransferase [Lujinxingia litoralis]RAL25185.1 hypothetical protein DL240_02960 [Lujinxingia litoralis]
MSQTAENPMVGAHRQVVERLWTVPLLDACADALPEVEGSTALSVESRCGEVVARWLKRLPEDTRLMALDSSSAMLDAARERVAESDQRRVFFVQQRGNALAYADGVFGATVCLHGLVTRRQLDEGLAELARVCASGGSVVAAAPTSASFPQFYDLLDEALRALGLHDVLERLGELRERTLITASDLAQLSRKRGLHEVELEQVRWELSFSGGRDFLYSPLIQETFFPHWSGAIRASERDAVLRYVARAIDTYWRDGTVNTQVEAVLLRARRV